MRIPDFLPPEKQGEVQFIFFKNLNYTARMRWYMLLVAVGIIVQLVLVKAFPGVVFLLCAAALNLAAGFDSRVRLEAYVPDRNWTSVDMERIHDIKKLGDRIDSWNLDALDITNGLGFIVFLLAAGAAGITAFILTSFYDSTDVALIFLLDVVILVLPLWFNGTRKVLKQGELQRKIAIIRELEQYFQLLKKENETFVPALLLARDQTGKSVPVDARFMIAFGDQPEGFYGVQAQIQMNEVQGVKYPYFYCVIAAKSGFGLQKYKGKIPANRGLTVEMQNDLSTEVIIIRLTTTKNSGYHTRTKHCKAILETALNTARLILKDY